MPALLAGQMLIMIRQWFAQIRNFARPFRAEHDLAREVDAHLAIIEDDYRRRGLSSEEARLAAKRAFGGVEQAKEAQRDARSFIWLEDVRRDIRHALRLVARSPIFTVTAIISLAIAIGANTTVFTLADALLLRPAAGVAQPDRLIDIGRTSCGVGFNPSSYPNYLDLQQRTTTLDAVYACSLFPQTFSLGSESRIIDLAQEQTEVVQGTFATGNCFSALGAIPAAGRLFQASDGVASSGDTVIVLSYRFWSRHFDKDRAVIGRTMMLDGRPFAIVGVTARGFAGAGVSAPDVWLPIGAAVMMRPDGEATLANRAAGWLRLGGRLEPGVSISQASAEAEAIGRALAREYPDQNRETGLRVETFSPVPGNARMIETFLALLMALAVLILLIACTNLVGLLLARGTARRPEIAIRLAMGAGSTRLVRQLLTETIVLFALGGVAGFILAHGLASTLIWLMPSFPFPTGLQIDVGLRAAAFTFGIALIAGVAAGLTPAQRAARVRVAPALSGHAAIWRRMPLRRLFLVVQVALSVLLVVVAGLFARALQQAGAIDPGFDPHGVSLLSLDLPAAGYREATVPLFETELLDRVHRLPGVQAATIAAVLPGGFESISLGRLGGQGVKLAEGEQWFDADWNIVGPGYFATLRMPLYAGRDFTTADRAGSEPVAIIGEGVAHRFWPGQNPIGKYIVERRGSTDKMLKVIGLASDPMHGTLVDGNSGLYVYVPVGQAYLPGFAMLVVRTAEDRQRVLANVRTLIASVDSHLPIARVQNAEEYTAVGLLPQRILAFGAGSLGLIGLLLAVVGIYGVMAYSVAGRKREIGIRCALGAARADIISLVVQEGLWLIVAGVVCGLILSVGASRLLAAWLLGLSPLDPLAFGTTVALFGIVGLAACYVPACRAVQVDPQIALRAE